MNQPATTRRQNQRFDVNLPVAVKHGEQAIAARALNASLGGLFIELELDQKVKLPLGARLHVRFEVVGHAVESNAVVRWHGDRGLGVQFDGLRARDVWALEKYFKSL